MIASQWNTIDCIYTRDHARWEESGSFRGRCQWGAMS